MKDDTNQDLLYEVIKKIMLQRKAKGWSHEYMAKCLDISTASYYKIETGTTKLTMERFLSISAILEIPLDEFFGAPAGSTVYNQEFRDNSANQVIENMYNDNKELSERYINRLEKEIEDLKK